MKSNSMLTFLAIVLIHVSLPMASLNAVVCFDDGRSIPLAGLTAEEINDYVNNCKMVVDTGAQILRATRMKMVTSNKVAMRAPGVNDLAAD